jgi:hypothetical protein
MRNSRNWCEKDNGVPEYYPEDYHDNSFDPFDVSDLDELIFEDDSNDLLVEDLSQSSIEICVKIAGELEEIDHKHYLLDEQEKGLLQRIETQINHFCRDKPAGYREKLDHIYWLRSDIGPVVRRRSACLLGRKGVIVPTPRLLTCNCPKCNKPAKYKVTDWKNYEKTCNCIRLGYQEYHCQTCKEQKLAEELAWRERQKRRDKEIEAERRSRTQESAKPTSEEVRRLKNMPYQEYLQSDHWKTTSRKMMRKSNFRCQLCSSKGQLNTHHNTYERRGEEEENDLVVLCKRCHEKFHNIIPEEGDE